jgi:hypothetical protein
VDAPATPAAEAAAAPAPAAAPAKDGRERKAEWDDDPDHKNAARIARVMVADLVLYHKDLIERGVREGTFHELLSQQIEEARKTYDSRVAATVRTSWDYLEQAFAALIERKRKELGLGESP